jgi:hypothetical protein
VESVLHLLTVFWGREEVTSQAEVLRNRAIGGQETLGMPWGFEPLHPSLSLARRLVGVLSSIVQVLVLSVLDTGQEFPFRG